MYKKCPCCNKEFYISDGFTEYWVYRIQNRFYCSWTCYRGRRKKRITTANDNTPVSKK